MKKIVIPATFLKFFICISTCSFFIPASKTAARVKYPAALQRCKFDAPLLAVGSLIWIGAPKNVAEKRFRRQAPFYYLLSILSQLLPVPQHLSAL